MTRDKTTAGLDAILKELGPFGTYNIVNYAFLLFPCFLAGMYGTVFVFEAVDINYRCQINECEGVTQESWINYAIPKKGDVLAKCYKYALSKNFTGNETCNIGGFDNTTKIECDSFVYPEGKSSVIKDFDLGCQNFKVKSIGTFHNAGLFLSLPMTGFISDKYGRKLALSLAALMNCIFGILRSFSTSYSMMVAFEFLEAGFGAGAYTTAFVLAMELVGPKGRVFGNTLINFVYVGGLMSLSGISWLLQDWRTLLRVIYAPSCLIFSYIWLLNESVRWLMSKGRHDEALVILKKAAKMNKVELSEQSLAPLFELENKGDETEREENTKLDANEKDGDIESNAEGKPSVFMQVLKSSIIVKRLLICSYMWITCTFVYHGFNINATSLSGNAYINFILVAFIEIPGNLCCLFVLDRFGRKRVLIIVYIISAILCFSLAFLPKGSWWALIFYLAGKFSITVAYSSVYVYVSELFPTNVRQSLLAICSATGRVGSSLAPLSPLLTALYENLPSIFFGSLAIVAGLLVFTLPETLNQPLPNSIEEAERISREKDGKS